MLNSNFQSKFFNNETFLIYLLYFSLLISFYLGENSTGGAVNDWLGHHLLGIEFTKNFSKTFLNYDTFHTRHSPVFLIFQAFVNKIFVSSFLERLFFLHISLILPFLFYKCLLLKFNVDKKILILLTSLIFISPTFRSLSIWPDSRLFGLLFFTLSIYYFLKFSNDKKIKYIYLNIFAYSLSSYISPNFSVFSVFFFFKYLMEYKFLSKQIMLIIAFNFLLAFPALYYVLILDINFFNKSASVLRDSGDVLFVNFFNDILITFTLIFFYIIPFIFINVIKINNYVNIKNLIFSLIIFIICAFNFDYNYLNTGGGIFLKTSQIFFGNNYFFFLISLISIFIILPILTNNNFNLLIFILIILNNPQYSMYHKYFDPFLLIVFFTIFVLNINLKIFHNKKAFLFVFFYFLSFLIISNIKFIWKI